MREDILKELSEYAKKRTEIRKEEIPAGEMKKRAFALPCGDFSFEKARDEINAALGEILPEPCSFEK